MMNLNVSKLDDSDTEDRGKNPYNVIAEAKAFMNSASNVQRRKEQQLKATKIDNLVPSQVVVVKKQVRGKNNSELAPNRKFNSFKGAKVLYDLLTPAMQTAHDDPSDGVLTTKANFEIKRKSKHPETIQPLEYFSRGQIGVQVCTDRIRALSNVSGSTPSNKDTGYDSPPGKRKNKNASVTEAKALERDNFY